MRLWSLAFIFLLAGCLDDAQTESLPVEAPDDEDAVQTTDPVSIHVDEPLTEGFPQTTWTLLFGPGGTGDVEASILPMEGPPQAISGGFCWHYEVEIMHDGGSSSRNGASCSEGGLSLGTHGGRDLFSQPVLPHQWGSMTLTFSADPQVARFVLDAQIGY